MAKTLIKILKQNFCQKCSECQDLSLESFWGYACFCPIQNGQNFETILSKMLRTTTFMVEFLWGYEYFHSIQNGQNNCKSFETKILSKMLRMSRFISGIFSKLCMFSPHTKWPKHLKKFSNKIFFEKCLECWDLSMEFFWRYTYFRPTQNDQNTFETKLLSKYSDCRDLSLEFFCGYSCFTPYKMAKTLIKILKQNFCQKCSECWDYQ